MLIFSALHLLNIFSQYCIHCISSLFNIILILIISIVLKDLSSGIAFLFTFIPIRQFTGGFHADTYFKCNMFFALSYILLMVVIKFIHFPLYLDLPILLLEFFLILKNCPIENVNKPFRSKKHLMRCKFISLLLFILFGVFATCLSNTVGQVIFRTLNLIIALCLIPNHERRRANEKANQDS